MKRSLEKKNRWFFFGGGYRSKNQLMEITGLDTFKSHGNRFQGSKKKRRNPAWLGAALTNKGVATLAFGIFEVQA